jgi:hypothetical protein
MFKERKIMKWCVCYSYKTLADAEIEASTKLEAKRKVLEVLPDVKIENIWETTDEIS